MSDEVRSILVGTVGLDVAALVALMLTITRPPIAGSRSRVRSCVRVALLATALQAAHFAEELDTHFYVLFPELLGLAPWPVSFFVSFNLGWLSIWVLSAIKLATHPRWALFPLWFLAISAVMNGVAHPFASLAVGGYFPGLYSSPVVGVVGVVLTRRLAGGAAGDRRIKRGLRPREITQY